MGALVPLLATLLFASPVDCQDRKVYKDAQEHRRGYFGPGRDEPEPQGLAEVLIGYFGPDDPRHPVGGTIWLGASLAVEEANEEGGYKDLPFRLKQGWSENPWVGGVSSVVRMAYLERVWAIIGSIDGSSTHLAEQVVAKARLTLIDPVSTDKSVNMANVPWMFSCVPADPAIAAVLGRALLDETRNGSFALLSSTDHDSRALAADFKSFLARNRATLKQHVEFPPNTRETFALAAQIDAIGVKAVVVLASAGDSARVIRDLRRRNENLLIFGGPSLGRQEFLEQAGTAAEAVRLPILTRPSQSAGDFARKFVARFGFPPDYAAMHAYDAVRLLVTAIRKAGLNRVRIRDAVEDLAPWQGTSGVIRWDAVGRNSREVCLGTVRNGRLAPAGELGY